MPSAGLTNVFVTISIFYIASVDCVIENKLNFIKRMYDQCGNSTDVFKCFKIKAIKVTDIALRTRKFELFPGVEVLQEKNHHNRTAKTLSERTALSDDAMERMENDEINDLLYELALNFLETHSVNVNLPKIVEEARRRRRKNRYGGALLAALAIKGAMMAMAYKGIAVMAGTALIIGKMALVLGAILGLKKLLSGDKEKTTVEIVKHPSHSSSHSYSSYDEGEGHYHRSMGSIDAMAMLEKLYEKYY